MTRPSLSRNGGGVLKAGSVEIQIPLAQSKTTELASTWLIEQAKKIPQMLNKTATLREQAIQAVTIKSALVTAARNSMQNASAAIQLGITNPVRSYNEIVNQFKDKYAGNSLYKKVMTEAVDEASLLRSVESPNFCFAAGTLVHTKDGLKPIEQIKLGDWVLSKPEGGSGEQAYKRVTRTVSFEDKEIWLVRFYKSGDDIEQIGVTANHPFWLANGGWTRADQLGMGSVIELADLSLGDILCSTPLYKTEKEGVALAYRAWGLEDVDGAMSEVDLIDAEIVVSEESYFSAENQRFTGKDF